MASPRIFCESLPVATAPYYREARVTLERRQTACRMRHCCTRCIEECSGRRKLGCTPTRSAERHPQGVCRIRKAAEPPTAAQQRMIGAEANRIAASNAATPRSLHGAGNKRPACKRRRVFLITFWKKRLSLSTCRPCRPCRRRERPVREARACRRRAPRWSAPWS